MMKKNEPYRILDGTALKIIAMISMVFDHVGDLLFPGQTWMRFIGRIALPIFAFCVAEGYIHTRNKTKYLLRLFLFGLVSELPYDLARSGRLESDQQNIMLTFALAILTLMLFDRITAGKKSVWKLIAGIAAAAVIGILSAFLRMESNFFVIGLILVFYIFRQRPHWIRILSGFIWHAALRNIGIYLWGLLSFIPLMMYNGEKGKGLKWFFYIFYPGHLLLLYLIRTFLLH